MLQGKHSAIFSTFIKLPFVKISVMFIFEWQLKTGFTVTLNEDTSIKNYPACKELSHMLFYFGSYNITNTVDPCQTVP